MPTHAIYWYDLAERVSWTFSQGFAAAWIVTGADFDSLFSTDNLKVGLAAGALSLAKSLAAGHIGDRNSAATLPSPPDHAPG